MNFSHLQHAFINDLQKSDNEADKFKKVMDEFESGTLIENGKKVTDKEAAVKIAMEKASDPCWDGYEQYGMKDKNGKKVPNCVKKTTNE